MPSYEYAIVTAFARSPFGGNPALVVFLDELIEDDNICANIAATLNQPVACFIAPSSGSDPKRARGADKVEKGDPLFEIRFWAPGYKETPLCGHGTLATTFALLVRKALVPADASVIRFNTRLCGGISARRALSKGTEAPVGDGTVSSERIEIELPSYVPTPAGPDVFAKLKAVVTKAFRKESVDIRNILLASEADTGTSAHAARLYVVEVAEEEDIGSVDFDRQAFCESAPYCINIVTARSSKPGVDYTYRMFAPLSNVPEDHVCGSANCLMGPYWADELGKTKLFTKQVSKRGGEVWVEIDEKQRKVRVQGEAAMVSKGHIIL